MNTLAKNQYKKNIFQFMNKNIFRNTVGNIRSHKFMKSMTDQENCIQYVVKPNLKDGCPHLKEVVDVQSKKVEIKIKKAEFFGQAILNLCRSTWSVSIELR